MKHRIGKHLNEKRYFSEGQEACKGNKVISDCPYTREWKMRAWTNGWMAHFRAIERKAFLAMMGKQCPSSLS